MRAITVLYKRDRAANPLINFIYVVISFLCNF